VHLRKKGRFVEAEAQDMEARMLSHQADPSIWCELAFLYWTAGRLDRMETFMKELLVAYPNFGFARFLHARLLKEKGRYDDALEELGFSQRLQYSGVTVVAEKASVEAYRGDSRTALKYLGDLRKIAQTQPVDNLLVAGVYAKLNDYESAFKWLDFAYAQRDSTLLSAATSPVLLPIRRDPRFIDLLRRLHFVVKTFEATSR
jgi:tetratricopeptide (TPR) repeat protein